MPDQSETKREHIRRRVLRIDGRAVRYTYNVRTREVRCGGIEAFTATCWDAAPNELRAILIAP